MHNTHGWWILSRIKYKTDDKYWNVKNTALLRKGFGLVWAAMLTRSVDTRTSAWWYTTSSVIPWIFNSPYDYKWLYLFFFLNKNLRCVLTQRGSSSLSRGKVGSTPADVLPSICKSLNVFCLICKLNLASSFTMKVRQTFFERLTSTDAFRPLSAPLKQVTWTVNF